MLENVKEIQYPAGVAFCCTCIKRSIIAFSSFSCFFNVKKGIEKQQVPSRLLKMKNTGDNFSVYQLLIVLLKFEMYC